MIQIMINIRLVTDEALKLHTQAFLAECDVQAQHKSIAEQRWQMFSASVVEMERRRMDTSALRKTYAKSVTCRALTDYEEDVPKEDRLGFGPEPAETPPFRGQETSFDEEEERLTRAMTVVDSEIRKTVVRRVGTLITVGGHLIALAVEPVQ